MLRDLIMKSRSYRRFHENVAIDEATLRELIDLARLSPSAKNAQPLRFAVSCEPERNASIFPHLTWAGYLKDWPGPGEGERPSAYIVVCGDTRVTEAVRCDHGIAAQSILLGAVERGLGGCMIGLFKRGAVADALGLPEHLDPLLVIALGKPREEIVIEEVGADGDIRYWRDERGVHHVPKRKLDDIIIG